MRNRFQNINESAQLYFITGIYYLHGKIVRVWNFSSVEVRNSNRRQIHFVQIHENISDELNMNRAEICSKGDVSNRFKFTSYRILTVSGFQNALNTVENN